jgi:alkylation response protein AidB-like acyl-CoA dehydrogenase
VFEFFSEEQKLVRKTIHAFVEDTIAPFAKQWDEQATCPQELWPKMAALGMIGSFIPESAGGVGFGLTERTIMIEEIARHSAGLAIAFMTNDITIAIIQDFASQELKDLYLPALLKGEKIGSFAVTEWTGGSDFSNQSSTITARDDHYLVSGQKCFVTNARFADFAIITGVEGTDANGRNIISAVLVPAEDEGFTWGRVEHKIGMKSSTTGDLIMKGIRIPSWYAMGPAGSGARVALQTIGRYGRSAMTAIAVGILRGCYEESISFAKQRIIYGKPLSRLYTAQSIIAQNRAEYEASHAMLYNAVSLQGNDRKYLPRISSAKLFCAEAAVRAAKRSMDMMGSYGLLDEYPIGRYLRDALAVIPSGGTSHIMSIVAARDALS